MSDEEFEVEAIAVEVSSQPIELYKVLKIANAVSGGGEAKTVISEGYVAVNGEVELRKRCKTYDGDVIEFNGEYYVVLCDEPVQEKPLVPVEKPEVQRQQKKPANKKSKSNKKSADADKPSKADESTGRKPISF